jgi:predicted dehydrogenase
MSRTSRRQFMQGTAAAGFGVWVATRPNPSLAQTRDRSPNERVQMASIGVGGKGGGDCDQAAELGDMVALCDVDDNTLNGKAKNFPKAKKFNDFRKMLEEMGDKIDAVTVSTPDHMHAPAAMMAMKMGKHVYCQKPMTHDVYEARRLREVAKEKGVATQMGNQGTAENGLRRGVELVQAGVIGPVKEVHIWTNRPIWPQAPTVTSRPPAMDPPKNLHWDLWLGTAPERPYAKYKDGKDAYHAFNWRGWWDFGTGALGDMACHTANLPNMALKLMYPTSIKGESGELNPETYPAWGHVLYKFPARGDMPAVDVHWYEGRNGDKRVLPDDEILAKLPKERRRGGGQGGLQDVAASASLMIGEKGWLYSPNDYGASWVILPEEKYKGEKFENVAQSLPRNGKGDKGMKEEWVAAMKGGPKAMSNFDYAGPLTEWVVMGNIAVRVPHTELKWDGEAMKFDNADANKFLKREYRKGWEL